MMLRGRAALICFFFCFLKNSRFRRSYTIWSIPVAYETRLTETAYLPNRTCVAASLISQINAYIHPNLIVLPVNYSKARLVVINIFLNFGHSAAPNPNNHVAALVLYGTQGSVRGLNRWEYNWLPLSPKFYAKQHRWRGNSHVFQVDQQMAE